MTTPSGPKGPGGLRHKEDYKPRGNRRERLTLDEACQKVQEKKGTGGRGGGLAEESFEQYFVDVLRVAIGKKPMHREKNDEGRPANSVVDHDPEYRP